MRLYVWDCPWEEPEQPQDCYRQFHADPEVIDLLDDIVGEFLDQQDEDPTVEIAISDHMLDLIEALR